jgi:hypothetical protein
LVTASELGYRFRSPGIVEKQSFEHLLAFKISESLEFLKTLFSNLADWRAA